MEVKYHKDYRHNYLILKSKQTGSDSYQSRMLAGNEIKGLLTCKERHINGEQLFYYEITSKQSLATFYECGGINTELLCRLFARLKMTWDAMSGFLLEERFLVLHPEYVFMDAETKEFFFLYFPQEPEEDYLCSLLEFLTEKVDTGDERAVDIVYKMMELAEREQFVMDEIIQWFEQDYDTPGCCDKPAEEVYESNHGRVYAQAELNDADILYDDGYESDKEVYEQHPAAQITSQQLLVYLVVSVMVMLGSVLVYLNFPLGNREVICLCAVFMIAMAALAFCLVQFLCKRFLPEEKQVKNEEQQSEKQQIYIPSYQVEEQNNREQPMYGNTVFIPWTESCENKLYGMGKGNKNHIDLNHLPVTVGKLPGSVDMVIDEPGISRRHVKFFRENGCVRMTDLNSTNGTFKNGMRLTPNASEVLEPGDEIRLGKLKFIYR